MNIKLLGELHKTQLKPLYHFEMPIEGSGSKRLHCYMRIGFFDYHSGETFDGYDYDSYGYQDLSKVPQHKMFCSMTKYKKFMERHRIWKDAVTKSSQSKYHGRLP